MTEAEARIELEPLFAALVRRHIAYSAVVERSCGKKAPLSIGKEIQATLAMAERYEFYHQRYWGPIASADAIQAEMRG